VRGGGRVRIENGITSISIDFVSPILSVSEETTDVDFFSRAEIEDMNIGNFDRQRIADGFASQEAAYIRDIIDMG